MPASSSGSVLPTGAAHVPTALMACRGAVIPVAAPARPFSARVARAVLLLGSPGSGKGTQARLLASNLDARASDAVAVLDWGQARRHGVLMGSPAGRRVAALGDLVARGEFVDDGLASDIFVEGLEKLGGASNEDTLFILDGFPRNVVQLRCMAERTQDVLGIDLRLELAIVLHAPFEVLLRRTDGRLIHKASGRTYHPRENPSQVPGRDDTTGEPLEPRVISTEAPAAEALRARIAIEQSEIQPLIEHLEAANSGTSVVHIDVGKDEEWFDENRRRPEQLHDDLVDVLQQHGLLRPKGPRPTSLQQHAGKKQLRHIGVVGLGPHARRVHYVFLQQLAAAREITIPIVVEVDTERAVVESYISERSPHTSPISTWFVPRDKALSPSIHPPLLHELDRLWRAGQLDGLVIASEPSSHTPYLRWALSRGVATFVDKPPTVPVPFSSERILPDFDSVLAVSRPQDARSTVCVQRRAHPGYLVVERVLSDVVKEFSVPISHVDISHADGMLTMPGEFACRRGHPYNLGYGKLVHSGYHFLDILAWMQAINEANVPHKAGVAVDPSIVAARQFGVEDMHHQMNAQDIQRLMGASATELAASMEQFEACKRETLGRLGELNVHALVQYLAATGEVATTATLNLMQNSLSRRSWFPPRTDVYKGNGRIRHERVVVTVGNLVTVHVHSYQSHEIGKPDAAVDRTSDQVAEVLGHLGPSPRQRGFTQSSESLPYGPGHEHHCDVTIYRNSSVVGGKPFEHLAVGDLVRRNVRDGEDDMAVAARHMARLGLSIGHNEWGRFALFNDWANGSTTRAPLHGQRRTMELMAGIYSALEANHSRGHDNVYPVKM